VRAGSLRQRVSFQSLVATQNSTTGVVTESWTEAWACWANIMPTSAKELIKAGIEQGLLTALVTMRYPYVNILPSMRMVNGSKTYRVHGIVPDLKTGNEYLTVMVSEVVDG